MCARSFVMFQTTLLITRRAFPFRMNDTGLKSSMGKVVCGSFKYMAFKDLIAKQCMIRLKIACAGLSQIMESLSSDSTHRSHKAPWQPLASQSQVSLSAFSSNVSALYQQYSTENTRIRLHPRILKANSRSLCCGPSNKDCCSSAFENQV